MKPQEIERLLAQSQQEQSDLQQQINELQTQLDKLQWRRQKLREHCTVLQELMHGPIDDLPTGDAPPPSEPTINADDQPITRAESIRQVLTRCAPEALSPKQIAERLPTVGRNGHDTSRDVSAALEGLKRSGAVHRTQRARWTITQ